MADSAINSALYLHELLTYCKIPVMSPGLIQRRKGVLVSKWNMFWQGSVILANVGWLHVSNCCKAVLQAQFFSKLPFGDHVIQKSCQLSNVGRQNKVIKFKKKSYFPWWHLVGYCMKRKLIKFQDDCSMIVVECTYALLQVFTQTE